MAKINVRDTALIQAPAAAVFTAVADVFSYPRWWPWGVRFTCLALAQAPGSFSTNQAEAGRVAGACESSGRQRIQVRPFGGPSFVCELEATEPGRELVWHYREGAYSGRGIWRVSPRSPEATEISYEVDLTARGPLMRLTGRFLPIAYFHSLLMRDVFRRLEKHCQRQKVG